MQHYIFRMIIINFYKNRIYYYINYIYYYLMKLHTSTEWLLFHLRKKNPETGKSCPGILITDTIIYRWAQPYFWYFTDKFGKISKIYIF